MSQWPREDQANILAREVRSPAGDGIVCRVCGTWNEAEEERCRTCQLRLKPPDDTAGAARPPYQRRLPLDPERPKVIPFDAARPPVPRAPRQPAGSSRPHPDVLQHTLDLAPPGPPAPLAQPAVHLPVAPLGRRVYASAVDSGLVLLGLALFLAPLHLATGRILVPLRTLPIYGVAAILLGIFYKLFWAIAGRDSPGLRSARLRLLNFDGLKATVRQRVIRFLAACFSVGGLGCGLLWALLDREKLAFHDQISETFLAASDYEPSSFQRK